MKLKSRMKKKIDFWEQTERIMLRRIAHGAVISFSVDRFNLWESMRNQ